MLKKLNLWYLSNESNLDTIDINNNDESSNTKIKEEKIRLKKYLGLIRIADCIYWLRPQRGLEGPKIK